VWFVYRVSWSPVDQKENCFGVGSLGGTKPGADLRPGHAGVVSGESPAGSCRLISSLRTVSR
jgi:hypothetical protein